MQHLIKGSRLFEPSETQSLKAMSWVFGILSVSQCGSNIKLIITKMIMRGRNQPLASSGEGNDCDFSSLNKTTRVTTTSSKPDYSPHSPVRSGNSANMNSSASAATAPVTVSNPKSIMSSSSSSGNSGSRSSQVTGAVTNNDFMAIVCNLGNNN